MIYKAIDRCKPFWFPLRPESIRVAWKSHEVPSRPPQTTPRSWSAQASALDGSCPRQDTEGFNEDDNVIDADKSLGLIHF